MLVRVRVCLTLSDKSGADSCVPYTKYQMLVCVLCIFYTLSSKVGLCSCVSLTLSANVGLCYCVSNT